MSKHWIVRLKENNFHRYFISSFLVLCFTAIDAFFFSLYLEDYSMPREQKMGICLGIALLIDSIIMAYGIFLSNKRLIPQDIPQKTNPIIKEDFDFYKNGAKWSGIIAYVLVIMLTLVRVYQVIEKLDSGDGDIMWDGLSIVVPLLTFFSSMFLSKIIWKGNEYIDIIDKKVEAKVKKKEELLKVYSAPVEEAEKAINLKKEQVDNELKSLKKSIAEGIKAVQEIYSDWDAEKVKSEIQASTFPKLLNDTKRIYFNAEYDRFFNEHVVDLKDVLREYLTKLNQNFKGKEGSVNIEELIKSIDENQETSDNLWRG